MKFRPHYNLLVFLVLTCSIAHAQFDRVNQQIALRNLSAIDSILINETLSEIDKNLIKGKLFVERNQVDSAFHYLLLVDTLSLSTYQRATYYDYLASAHDQNIEYDLVLTYINKAKELYDEIGLKNESNEMTMQMYLTLLSSPFFKGDDVSYLNTFHENAKKLNNYSQLSRAEINLAFENFDMENPMGFTDYFDRAIEYAEKSGNPIDLARIYTYYGMMYGENFQRPELAEKYYDDALEIYESIEDGFKQKPIYILKANLARQKNDTQESIRLLKYADSLTSSSFEIELNLRIYKQLAEDYKSLGEVDSAFAYMKKFDEMRDQFAVQQQNINMTRFEAEKKDKENLILQKKNQRSQFIIVIISISAFLLAIVSLLLYKNFKKKQQLKEKEFEILRNQFESKQRSLELGAIDRLLTAQEEERQNLASELHDNIGSILTATNMHFNVLEKEVKQQVKDDKLIDLLDKTSSLLEDAYKDIRKMAHYKNAGQMAHNGLIPAVRNLAKKSASLKGIEFDLNLSDLSIRLNNKVEIGLFRTIQELITNALKHASPSLISISIFEENKSLTIMIEDDGKGFDVNSVLKNTKQKDEFGIGLHSLYERINDYKGKMKIESTPGEGTTVIIEVPVD